MRAIYFVTTVGYFSAVLSKRVTETHRCIFHGSHLFLGEGQNPEWRNPALTNVNRERIHIFRSGTFVPPVFSPYVAILIVSAAVKARCEKLVGVEFQPVVFERLVEIPLPPLGQCDLNDLITEQEMREKMEQMPDVQEFRESVGEYFYVLTAVLNHLNPRPDDVRKLEIGFGTYHYPCISLPKFSVSLSLFEKYSIYASESGTFCFSEEAFAVFAPFLDLDYFKIGMLKV